MFWKRQLPAIVAFVSGIVMIAQYFIPNQISQAVFQKYTDYIIIVAAFAAVMGYISMIRHHAGKVYKKARNWPFSAVALVALFITAFVGFVWGRGRGTPFYSIYLRVMVPINATMFSLLGFYIASAAYRAFRAHSAQATALLISAVLVMLGRVPIGKTISFWSDWTIPFTSVKFPSLVDIANWIMNVPNTAAKRAIKMGVALGIILMALKIILGIERSYLGQQ